MSIRPMKELIMDASKEDRAVGAFNVGKLERLIAGVKARKNLTPPLSCRLRKSG